MNLSLIQVNLRFALSVGISSSSYSKVIPMFQVGRPPALPPAGRHHLSNPGTRHLGRMLRNIKYEAPEVRYFVVVGRIGE